MALIREEPIEEEDAEGLFDDRREEEPVGEAEGKFDGGRDEEGEDADGGFGGGFSLPLPSTRAGGRGSGLFPSRGTVSAQGLSRTELLHMSTCPKHTLRARRAAPAVR